MANDYEYGDYRYFLRPASSFGKQYYIIEKFGKLSNGLDAWLYESAADTKEECEQFIKNQLEATYPSDAVYFRTRDYNK